jgi:hypothetical protein
LTLCNTSSFLTQSVQLIFSFLLPNHIPKLSRYFWSHRILTRYILFKNSQVHTLHG